MTPAARIQEAIAILEALDETQRPADRFIRDWFRKRRYAGSKDRASVAERVFSVLRHRASLAWRMQSDSPRALLIAALLEEDVAPAEIYGLFSGDGHAPDKLNADERAAINTPPRSAPPLPVMCEFPAWLERELSRAFGEDLEREMTAFNERAAIDLRVNTLKAERDHVLGELLEAGFEAAASRYVPDGIRIAPGPRAAALQRHALYRSGAFEFQDEAAQIAVVLASAKSGMNVLDCAAGAGGKSLALAAAMENKGRIVACDIRAAALAELRERASRAGASIIVTQEKPPPEEFDLVFLDAPCSGSGTWRRQPELKWRLTQERLDTLTRTQDALLAEAATHVKAGGRLVYATCSILPSENEDRATRLGHPFRAVAANAMWPKENGELPPSLGAVFHASPFKTATDGFFTAIFERTS